MDEKKLEALLVRKLAGMPKDHLPILKLTDILGQTPMAAHLLHIPSDLQLTFFLANRSVINANLGLAIKDSSQQSLDITRAIFFYRLDTAHQFARYHDSSRWNISLYIALLSLPPHATSFYSPTYISPAARRFMLSYLDAVVETHNEPYTFGRREAFIDLWKESAYDFFSIKAASQAKFIRRQTVRLNAEWEAELDGMRKSMKQDDYKARVVPWVGVLIPGRVDQGRRVVGINAGARGANNTGKQDVRDKSNVEEGRNKLLEALMVPLDEMEVDVDGQSGSAQYELVCKLPAALAALKNMSAKEMLAALFRMF
ncbi:hypothetical protein K504DRAFT_382859 [Pleomassaria siparia CBS 279.74]|uniref:Uncharacterized protein n=1 Tax=Pleomassaria siparia CBS 279.74 TaxID=1314801 RepID=A0A6G1K5Y6_9PLEO|nr:hypothetical protein K504DRAFT_382859 [Pleomassaria siparia CBS 279.74]